MSKQLLTKLECSHLLKKITDKNLKKLKYKIITSMGGIRNMLQVLIKKKKINLNHIKSELNSLLIKQQKRIKQIQKNNKIKKTHNINELDKNMVLRLLEYLNMEEIINVKNSCLNLCIISLPYLTNTDIKLIILNDLINDKPSKIITTWFDNEETIKTKRVNGNKNWTSLTKDFKLNINKIKIGFFNIDCIHSLKMLPMNNEYFLRFFYRNDKNKLIFNKNKNINIIFRYDTSIFEYPEFLRKFFVLQYNKIINFDNNNLNNIQFQLNNNSSNIIKIHLNNEQKFYNHIKMIKYFNIINQKLYILDIFYCENYIEISYNQFIKKITTYIVNKLINKFQCLKELRKYKNIILYDNNNKDSDNNVNFLNYYARNSLKVDDIEKINTDNLYLNLYKNCWIFELNIDHINTHINYNNKIIYWKKNINKLNEPWCKNVKQYMQYIISQRKIYNKFNYNSIDLL